MNIIKVVMGDFEIVDSSPRTVYAADAQGYRQNVVITEVAASYAVVAGGLNRVMVPALPLDNANIFYTHLNSTRPDTFMLERVYSWYDPKDTPPSAISSSEREPVSTITKEGKYFSTFQIQTQVVDTITVMVGAHPSPNLVLDVPAK